MSSLARCSRWEAFCWKVSSGDRELWSWLSRSRSEVKRMENASAQSSVVWCSWEYCDFSSSDWMTRPIKSKPIMTQISMIQVIMTPNMLCPLNVLSPKLLNVSTAKIGVALSTVNKKEKFLALNNNCPLEFVLSKNAFRRGFYGSIGTQKSSGSRRIAIC